MAFLDDGEDNKYGVSYYKKALSKTDLSVADIEQSIQARENGDSDLNFQSFKNSPNRDNAVD